MFFYTTHALLGYLKDSPKLISSGSKSLLDMEVPKQTPNCMAVVIRTTNLQSLEPKSWALIKAPSGRALPCKGPKSLDEARCLGHLRGADSAQRPRSPAQGDLWRIRGGLQKRP